nr:MAG TPA: hypothetical protein [Caudoviricetes sp.]
MGNSCQTLYNKLRIGRPSDKCVSQRISAILY